MTCSIPSHLTYIDLYGASIVLSDIKCYIELLIIQTHVIWVCPLKVKCLKCLFVPLSCDLWLTVVMDSKLQVLGNWNFLMQKFYVWLGEQYLSFILIWSHEIYHWWEVWLNSLELNCDETCTLTEKFYIWFNKTPVANQVLYMPLMGFPFEICWEPILHKYF